jgi:WD40 repeat protein
LNSKGVKIGLVLRLSKESLMRRNLLNVFLLLLTLSVFIFALGSTYAQETAEATPEAASDATAESTSAVTPEPTVPYEPLPEAYSLDWNSDGSIIAVGTMDGVFLYDMTDPASLPVQMLPGFEVTSVVFHPTEPTWLAVNPRQRKESIVSIIDVTDQLSIFDTNVIVDEYTDLSFSGDGETLVAVAGGVPVVYPIDGIAQPYILYAPEPSGFSRFAISPNGEQIAAAQGADLYIDYFDAAEEAISRFALVEIEDDLTAIAFSPESDVMMVGDERGSLRKWSLPDLTYTSFIRGERSPNSNRVNDLEFAARQPLFYSAEGDPLATIRVFQVQAIRAMDAFGFPSSAATDALDLALNPDETQIAALLNDNTVYVLNLVDKSRVARLALPPLDAE